MSKISLQPNASGTGTFTLAAPDSNTNRTLTLPDEAGKVLTDVSTIDSSNLQSDVYKQANILGTVSQSGGVPTGAIIERDSNANGEYVKYADGTMICSVRGLTLPRTAFGNIMETPWFFPVSFTNSTNLSTVMSIRNNGANFVGFTGWSDAQVRERMTSSFANTTLFTTSVRIGQNFDRSVPSGATLTGVCATAIGRWY